MCVGVLTAIGIGLSLVGTMVQAAGIAQEADARAQASEYQALQDQKNAILAKRNAEDSRQRGVAAEQDVQLRTRARLGLQKNILSERNIAVNSGTPLDILGDTAMFGKMDALTTRGNFEREAIAYETQRMNFDAQAELGYMEADHTREAGRIAAFSTALGGLGGAFGSFAKLRV